MSSVVPPPADPAPPAPAALDLHQRRLTLACHTAGLVLLVAATWLVYRPALAHVPRWDQWWFLREAAPYQDFAPLLRHCYSYNRTSNFGRGDFELFRPALFALLCAEKVLFDTNFSAWQRFGLGLHLAVVLLLLLLLLRLRLWLVPDAASSFCPLAYTLGLFFALNVSLAEAVMWTHIHGYILFVGLVLAAVLLVLPELTGRPDARRFGLRLAAAWMLLAVAVFTHEVGQLFAVVFALVLALALRRAGRPRRAVGVFLAFAILLPLYQAANSLDLALHGPLPTRSPWELLPQTWGQVSVTGWNVARYLLYTFVQPFFPSCLEWSYFGRLVINEPVENPGPFIRPGPLLAVSYATLALLLLTGLAALATLPRRPRTDRGPALAGLLLLPVSLAGVQTLLNVLGRLNVRPGSGQLISSSYYAYLPFACLLIVLYVLWQASRSGSPGRPRGEYAVLAGLLVVTTASAARTREIAGVLRDHHRQVRTVTRDIRAVLHEHRHDPAFRFAFDPPLLARLDRDRGVTFPEILFPRHLDPRHPTCVFVLRDKSLAALPLDEYCRVAGRSPSCPFPELEDGRAAAGPSR